MVFKSHAASIALAAGLLAGAGSAYAGSRLTVAFIANVKPNVEFLARSSRVAAGRSTDRRVVGFAGDMVTKETIVGNSIVAWWQSNTEDGATAALGEPLQAGAATLDPLHLFSQAPREVQANQDRGTGGEVTTGRSVSEAGDGMLASRQSPNDPSSLLPSQQADLHTLESLRGRKFDAFYEATQRNALRQLAALYRDYATSGDDPALRSIAAVQLPQVNTAIERLNRM